MESIKQKLQQYHEEANAAIKRAEEAEAKNKHLEHLLIQKDEKILSLTARLTAVELDLEKHVTLLEMAKPVPGEEQSKTYYDILAVKVQLLDEELATLDEIEKSKKMQKKVSKRFEQEIQRAEREEKELEKELEEIEAEYKRRKADVSGLEAGTQPL